MKGRATNKQRILKSEIMIDPIVDIDDFRRLVGMKTKRRLTFFFALNKCDARAF
jgi:hypothetical protein